jgi:dTDP-4-amino-4,6-dideoxygalactose transaminase
MRFGRSHGVLRNTDDLSARLIRLPLFVGLTESQQERVRDALRTALSP